MWFRAVLLIKTIIFTFVVPGTVTILMPYWLLSSSRDNQLNLGFFRYFGVVAMLLGIATYFWCAWDFTFAGRGTPAPIDPPKKLVVRGLYRYVRNPMYVGVVAILLGEAILFSSLRLFAYCAIVFSFFFLFILIYEEPILTRKFGESYRDYRRTVPRWFPRFKKS